MLFLKTRMLLSCPTGDNINGNYTIKCGYTWILNNKGDAVLDLKATPRKKRLSSTSGLLVATWHPLYPYSIIEI